MWPFTRCQFRRVVVMMRSVKESVRANTGVVKAQNRAIMEMIQMLSQNVKNLVETVANMKSIVQSSNTAWGNIMDLVADQRRQIGDLQAKLADGSLTSDDIQAVDAAAKDVHDLALQMQAAVPANTTGEPEQQPSSEENVADPAPVSGDASTER